MSCSTTKKDVLICYTAEKIVKTLYFQDAFKEWYELYRHIFNRKFNLSFHQPLSDTCNKCDQLNLPRESKIKLSLSPKKILGQRKAEYSMESKLAVNILAKNSKNNEIVSICFDLQKKLCLLSSPQQRILYFKYVCWGYYNYYNPGITYKKKTVQHFCILWKLDDV